MKPTVILKTAPGEHLHLEWLRQLVSLGATKVEMDGCDCYFSTQDIDQMIGDVNRTRWQSPGAVELFWQRPGSTRLGEIALMLEPSLTW